MNKEEIKKALKRYGYTVIGKSWFADDEVDGELSALFNAYDNFGNCVKVYVDASTKCATMQSLSALMIHKPHDISYMFWKD